MNRKDNLPAQLPLDNKELMEKAATKLIESVTSGNVEAIKTYQSLQRENRYYELINNMDEDEFTD